MQGAPSCRQPNLQYSIYCKALFLSVHKNILNRHMNLMEEGFRNILPLIVQFAVFRSQIPLSKQTISPVPSRL